MNLISYREAAKVAECSLASIQRAIKSGALAAYAVDGKKGLDQNAVCFWAFLRNRKEADTYIVARMYHHWMNACARVTSELRLRSTPRPSCVPSGPAFNRKDDGSVELNPIGLEIWDDEDTEIVRNRIFSFVEQVISWDLQYLYSEKVFFPESKPERIRIQIEGLKLGEICKEDELETIVDGLMGDVDFRCEFSLFHFAADNLWHMSNFIRSLGIDQLNSIKRSSVYLDSFLSFRDELKNRGIEPEIRRSKMAPGEGEVPLDLRFC